ncbi:MAG TPA: heavy metal-binding domain-containing protein, partial [Thermoanaerobaculia bacterium]
GGHGAAGYRHVDAGRGPEAHEGSEPQPPGAGHEHHGQDAALFVCPMHPEVTSETAGTCPKCGMKLVERREE